VDRKEAQQHGTPWSAASGIMLDSGEGLVDAEERDASQQHHEINSTPVPARGEKAAPMADINVQHAAPARPPKSPSLRCRCKDGLADATVMEGHEGCAWGRRVGKGREACLSWASVPECDTRLGVRALASPGRADNDDKAQKSGRRPLADWCFQQRGRPRQLPSSEHRHFPFTLRVGFML
jgi:hypothetical protein